MRHSDGQRWDQIAKVGYRSLMTSIIIDMKQALNRTVQAVRVKHCDVSDTALHARIFGNQFYPGSAACVSQCKLAVMPRSLSFR